LYLAGKQSDVATGPCTKYPCVSYTLFRELAHVGGAVKTELERSKRHYGLEMGA
jgi:hypothetical protein